MSSAPASADPIPLTQLRPGRTATLEQCDLAAQDCELLSAMGLTGRCSLRVCRNGRLCIVQVASTRLGISADIARRILVRPTNPA